jgi:hypothetical protein
MSPRTPPTSTLRQKLLAALVLALALGLGLLLVLRLTASVPGAEPQEEARSEPPWGTGQSRPEDLGVQLVVFGPGHLDDIPSWWGHAALAVEDRQAQHARLYNYGMFDFRKFNEFALGRLDFYVDDAPVVPYLRFYRSLDRDVRLVDLNLEPSGAARVAAHLAQNVRPEHRHYLYDHYRDNCATRLRDAIDLGTGGQFKQFLAAPGRMTLREHTRRYTAVSPPVSVLLDFMMNDSIDRPLTRWDEAFLPDELEASVRDFRYTRADGSTVPLLKETRVVHASRSLAPARAEPLRSTPWLLGGGLAWGALALGLGAWWSRSGRAGARVLLGLHTALTGLLLGLLGTVLLGLWAVTDHAVTFHNENLLLANPLTLLALPLGLSLARGREPRTPGRLRRLWGALGVLALLGLALKALPAFDQDNWNILAGLLPAVLGLGAAHARAPAREAARAGSVPSLG